jgi:hypothetical protein
MRHSSFVAFILTHGRADRVYTYETLRKHGYTGRIVLVVDNEDATLDNYRSRFPADDIVVFDKAAVAARIDEADNFSDRRAIIYARNACFDIASDLGVEFFIELDDDYVDFRHKRDATGKFIDKADIRDLDSVFDVLLDYFEKIPALSIAMAQGGDFIGGTDRGISVRKCMNSFICATARPFRFVGRTNDDVSTYTSLGSRGELFLTTTTIALQQKQTQANVGGMTEVYLASGTYVKSFYSVMVHPSSVRVSMLPSKLKSRIHHKVRWRFTMPCIVREECRKPRP